MGEHQRAAAILLERGSLLSVQLDIQYSQQLILILNIYYKELDYTKRYSSKYKCFVCFSERKLFTITTKTKANPNLKQNSRTAYERACQQLSAPERVSRARASKTANVSGAEQRRAYLTSNHVTPSPVHPDLCLFVFFFLSFICKVAGSKDPEFIESLSALKSWLILNSFDIHAHNCITSSAS